MTDAERAEMIRLRLIREMEEANAEMNFVKEIILISKELNTTIDDILDWSWKRYVVVTEALKEIYEEQKREVELNELKAKTFR